MPQNYCTTKYILYRISFVRSNLLWYCFMLVLILRYRSNNDYLKMYTEGERDWKKKTIRRDPRSFMETLTIRQQIRYLFYYRNKSPFAIAGRQCVDRQLAEQTHRFNEKKTPKTIEKRKKDTANRQLAQQHIGRQQCMSCHECEQNQPSPLPLPLLPPTRWLTFKIHNSL